MNLEFCRQIFEQYSNIKFHENPSIGSLQKLHADGQTDTTKLIVAFCNFASEPKKVYLYNDPQFCSAGRHVQN
jgi:hypothetical protein